MKELESNTGEEAEPDVQREALVRLLKGQLPAFVYCPQAMDVAHALALIDEFNLDAILVLGRDCYKAVDHIAASGLPVILDEELVFWETDERTEEETQIVLPRIYREAGIKPVFQEAGGSPTGALIGTNFLWFQAATAMKYGAPAEEALEAITLRPAQVLGVDEFVGTLEVGKDADMAILSGDPLEINTWVEVLIADGEVIYELAEDKQLQQLLKKVDK
jgi:imidazolonepropionase-like amidohydrolase